MILNESYSRLFHLFFYFALMHFILIFSFLTNNILYFFISFEAALIPLFLIVGGWGSRPAKQKAAYYLFFYTFLSSLFFFCFLGYFYAFNASFSYTKWVLLFPSPYILLFLSLPFLTKLPLWPFHLWLPLAHVEAPTIGSVVLASLVLKMGAYGLIRFWLPFPSSFLLFPFLISLSLVSLLYAAFLAGRQADFKRLVAYSSVSHMGVFLLGVLLFSSMSIKGSYLIVIGHGLSSAGLFSLVGFIYTRTHLRTILYFSGFIHSQPLFSLFFVLLFLGSMAFPPSINFLGELLVLNQVFISLGAFFILYLTISLVIGVYYHLFVLNRVLFGAGSRFSSLVDLSFWECFLLLSWFIPLVLGGIISLPWLWNSL